MNFFLFQLLIFSMCAIIPFVRASEYDTVKIMDYGIASDSRQNATLAVKRALHDAKMYENPLVIFEKGRYDFWPQHCEERIYYESNTTDVNPKRLAMLKRDLITLSSMEMGLTLYFMTGCNL